MFVVVVCCHICVVVVCCHMCVVVVCLLEFLFCFSFMLVFTFPRGVLMKHMFHFVRACLCVCVCVCTVASSSLSDVIDLRTRCGDSEKLSL